MLQIQENKSLGKVMSQYNSTRHVSHRKGSVMRILKSEKDIDYSLSTFAKFPKELTFLTPIRTRKSTYQGVRNISFSENFAKVLNKWFHTSQNPDRVFYRFLNFWWNPFHSKYVRSSEPKIISPWKLEHRPGITIEIWRRQKISTVTSCQ